MGKVTSKRAWGILAACCAFYAGSMALTSSILGVYMLPVSESIGVTRAEFTFYMTIQGIATLAFLPIVGNLFNKAKNFSLLMSIGSIALAAGIFCFSFCSAVWQFCLFCLPIAFGMVCLYSVGGPTLITNWFAPKHRGKMLGIAAAFSGVGTFVWAPMFTAILQSVGWQTTYMVNAALSLVLTLPFCLFGLPKIAAWQPLADKTILPKKQKAQSWAYRPKTPLKPPASIWSSCAASLAASAWALTAAYRQSASRRLCHWA